VPLVADASVRAFVENTVVKSALDKEHKASTNERVRTASGAPGRLLSGAEDSRATINARKIIDAARSPRASLRYSTALSQGAANARGGFADTLEALVDLLGENVRDALHRNDDRSASAASTAVDAVLRAQTYASGNVSPQILTARLIHELSEKLK
jgi:hypothetical protein